MQSLGHACIFCTSNPRGQTSYLVLYVVVGNSLSLGSIFLTSFSNSPNLLSDKPFVVFHCSNSKVVPSFFNPFSQSGYNNLRWSSNIFWIFNLSISLSQSACTLCNACPRSSLGSSSTTSTSGSSMGISSSNAPIPAFPGKWSSKSSSSLSSMVTPCSPCFVQQTYFFMKPFAKMWLCMVLEDE